MIEATDGLIQSLVTFLIAQGPIGVLCLVLLYAIYRIWNLYVATQEKRIEEAKESITAMHEYTKSLRVLAEQYRSIGDDDDGYDQSGTNRNRRRRS